MTHYVDEACIKCKYTDCVDVCPVDCFYEGNNILVIHPEECIDCGICIAECPVDAIKTDEALQNETISNKEERLFWLNYNGKYAKIWPRISEKKSAPLHADEFAKINNKKEFLIENEASQNTWKKMDFN